MSFHIRCGKIRAGGADIFYREAGREDAPVIVLFHGFPTASYMFSDLMPILAEKYHVIAPDYPGFGESEMVPRDKFAYTFDHLSVSIYTRTAPIISASSLTAAFWISRSFWNRWTSGSTTMSACR